jgi:hypothetical protein
MHFRDAVAHSVDFTELLAISVFSATDAIG